MILYTPKTTYAIHFTHVRATAVQEAHLLELLGPRAGGVQAWTICSVHEGKCTERKRDDKGRLGPCLSKGCLHGQTFCAREDIFNKAIGRKIAFGRAIASLNRDVRTALWRGYLLKTGVLGEVH